MPSEISPRLASVQSIGGVPRGGFPWWFITRNSPSKSFILVETEDDVLGMVDDIKSLFKMSEWGLPPSFDVVGYPVDDEAARQVSLTEWAFGLARALVASVEGMALSCDPPQELQKRTFHIKPGLRIGREAFFDVLSRGGYSRTDRTEQVGEYSVRGEVIDVWPPSDHRPIRIVWNFDTVEALRPIDPFSQRSEGYLTEMTLHPVLAGSEATLIRYVTPELNVVFFSSQPEPKGIEVLGPGVKPIVVGPFDQDGTERSFGAPPSFAGQIPLLIKQLVDWHDQDYRVAIFCHNRGEKDRLEELLSDPMAFAKGLPLSWMPTLLIGALEHGFIHETQRLAVLANSEIFGRYRKRVRLPKFDGGGSLGSVMDVRPHDYLVHEKHGIGRYLGLRPLKVKNVTSEFLAIEYKGGDKLYVPIFEIQQVQRYLGAEGRRPALSSLDTASWERICSHVKEDVAKLAADLLRKAAKRSIRAGFSFPPRTHLEDEFSSSFMYDLTPDQVKTLEEVEADMMNPKAMDRLICGDVGFGKTEIAMRAALKCALAGKQVALLCPTTILAEQHARNFSERLADYPVTVGFLSRFQTRAEQKPVIEKMSKGILDIVIGTHRLLSADAQFRDLGLLIIDEEHRFGVKQKSKLLALRETVDVLSLTATPIPRTLASSLGGIKDLSVIETAPEGRLPVSTHVGLFDEDVMVKAVQQELDRGGQVFYVHNRVKTLLARKNWLQSVLPSIRIVMAHGQMKEHELEKAMHDFLHNKFDVLLSTTIIESGLDIPSVNTLIVEEAEEYGLAQLYQLRGRVGRARTRASCYLFYSASGMTTDAKKRLEALREYTALGSGFRLAMRDMEIRGAGNLLGPQQHGNMTAVGVETYSRLLNEEIQKLKGELVEEDFTGPLLELSLSAYIPEDYMPAEFERVQMYKRILSADSNQLVKLKEELVDRCGPLPEPVQTLLDAASLRIIIGQKGISEVHQEEEGLLIYFRANFKLPEASFQLLLAETGKTLTLIPGPRVGVRFRAIDEERSLDTLGRFLRLIFPAS